MPPPMSEKLDRKYSVGGYEHLGHLAEPPKKANGGAAGYAKNVGDIEAECTKEA